MLFWIGFIVMVLNEGFVIMRHVHPWFARKREALMAKYGSNWKRFHAALDYVWIGGVTLGIAVDIANWKLYFTVLMTFWTVVGVCVYLPLLVKKLRKKKVKVENEDVHLHSDGIYPYNEIKKVHDEVERKKKNKNKQLDEDAIRKAGW